MMVFGGGQVRDKLNPKIKVKELSENELDVWNKLSFPIFEMPIEWKRGIDKISLEFIRNGVKFYVAYFREKAVGTCALFSSMRTGGIFAVGTQKESRRRGIGTTLTVHAIKDSIDEGNNLHTVQARKGEYAERFYRRIGFETDHTISWFVKKFNRRDRVSITP